MSRGIINNLFWAVLCLFIFSSFNRNSPRNIDEISYEILEAPVLKQTNSDSSYQIINKGFRFTLIPISECEINGLIVDKIPYAPVRIMHENALGMNKNFTIMWGSNVRNKTYKNKAIKFSYGGINWQGNTNLNLDELARVALITQDKNLWSRIKSLSGGDQVKIIGKLVNGSGDRIIPVTYCSNHLQWNTGMPGKNDEFWNIYVEDLKILKKANVLFNYLFWISLFGLIVLIIIRLFGPIKYYE